MLLRKPVQLAVNAIVLLMLVSFAVAGLLMVLPTKTTVGTLLGKMASQRHMLSGIVSGLDPKALAEAINDNPEFLNALIQDIAASEEGPGTWCRWSTRTPNSSPRC